MRRLFFLLAVAILTMVSQIGGAVLIVAWLGSRLLPPQRRLRSLAVVVLFAVLYSAATLVVVPPLAALAGRVPLPCRAEPGRPVAAGHPLYCLLNRNYVDPRLVPLLDALAAAMDRAHPGTVTLYLDAGFPFLDGMPLAPHLSHDDGRKLDLAFFYTDPDGGYRPSLLRSPIGYWAFEQPGPGDPLPCTEPRWLTLRWDMTLLQGLYLDRPLEPERTRTALAWLLAEGPRFGLEKILLEPHLVQRFGLSSPLLRFQGCRAARHDDHLHLQIAP
ncbi:hypothetical protein KXR53_29150 [Inquilinus limosus]|uniref:hypothetical protein n=1 Tax=Inquilinus limosus TaxID=171674 RepID=UPI003F13670A